MKSFNPRKQLLLGTALVGALISCYGRRSYAGSCAETAPGSGIWNCTGPALSGTDITQAPTSTAGGALTVSTSPGFGIDVTGDAFDLHNSIGDTNISFTDNNSSNITGSGYGLRVNNVGTGTTYVKTTGTVIGGFGPGLFITTEGNNTATDVTVVAQGSVTGSTSGIRVRGLSGNGSIDITANNSTGLGTTLGQGYGIYAWGNGTNTKITTMAGGIVTGGYIGISALGAGSGTNTIIANGKVYGGAGSYGAIYSRTKGTSLSITTNDIVSGDRSGIITNNYGAGSTTIKSFGAVTSLSGKAILVTNTSSTLDLTITTVDVTGATEGINATNNGTGETIINTTAGTVTGTTGTGIVVNNGSASSDLTVTTSGAVSGGLGGIQAAQYGSGILHISANADVAGDGGNGIWSINDSTAGLAAKIDIGSGSTVKGGVAGIRAEADAGQTSNIANFGVVQNLSGLSTALAITANTTSIAKIDNKNLVTGKVTLGNLADSFTNESGAKWNTAGGTNDFGAGVDSVSNSGRVIAAGAAGTAETTNFNNLESFSNAGLLTLSDGGASSDKAFVSGNFIGAGGVLALDTVLGSDGSITDLLQVGGNSTGASLIHINNVGGAGALTHGNGIRVVDVQGGTSAAGAFSLDAPVASGLFDYRLYQNGLSNTDGDWYLRSTVNSTVAAVIAAPAAAEDVSLTFLGTLHERVGEQEQANRRQQAGTLAGAMWSRLIGKTSSETLTGPTVGDLDSSSNLTGMQTGLDVLRSKNAAGSTTVAGLFGGYAWDQAMVSGGSLNTEGWLGGVYATHFSSAGWYSDAVLQGSWFDVAANGGRGAVNSTSKGWLASLEMGLPIALGNQGSAFEPQAQLIYSSTQIDSSDVAYSFDRQDSVIGRVGFRLKGTHDNGDGNNGRRFMTGYLKANLWSNFSGDDASSTVNSALVDVSGKSLWADAGLGLTMQASENSELFADADFEYGLDQAYSALTAKAGVKWAW